MRILTALFAVLLAIAAPATAQTLPEFTHPAINDYAELLTEADETALIQQIETLKADTGVDLSVLTLHLQAFHAAADVPLETFAQSLFDSWAKGQEQRSDGILVLVLRSDRAIRIEMGENFGTKWDETAAKVIERSFVPAFREDRYADGIKTGVSDVITSIARPAKAPAPAKGSGAGDGGGIALWKFGAGVAAILIALFSGRWLPHVRAPLHTCPSCGKRGASYARSIMTQPTETTPGQGRKAYTCKHCAHADETLYPIAARGKSQPKDATPKDGKSGGGGASGKW